MKGKQALPSKDTATKLVVSFLKTNKKKPKESLILKLQKPVFRGVATALVTPMKDGGKIDFETLGRLIDWQINSGIDGLVIAGTTGEGSTLSDEEHREVLKASMEFAGGRVPMIAGTGSNDAAYAIDLSRYACKIGYDALLLVTPYYNKATQGGLVATFRAITDATDKPVILYNVPSRTGVNIDPATYNALADHERIVAAKEASGSLSQLTESFALAGDRLDIYSGNDDQIFPVLAMGGTGVISVLSNILPKETCEICRAYFAGDLARSRKLQYDLLPLIHALFSEVNPIPVKAAMAKIGFGENVLRLPLTPMEEAHKKVLFDRMSEWGL